MSSSVELRRRIAAGLVGELQQDPDVLCALLTGSTARGDATDRSDIDIVLVRLGRGRAGEHGDQREGVSISYEAFSADFCSILVSRKHLPAQQLRVASRIFEGELLLDRDGYGERLQDAVARLELLPAQMEQLLDGAATKVASAKRHAKDDPERAVFESRAAVHSLVMARLLAQPPWFSQPKWMIRDLRALGEERIVEAFLAILGLGEAKGLAAGSLEAADSAGERVGQLADATDSLGASDRRLKLALAAKYRGNAAEFLGLERWQESMFCSRVAMDLVLAALFAAIGDYDKRTRAVEDLKSVMPEFRHAYDEVHQPIAAVAQLADILADLDDVMVFCDRRYSERVS